MRFDPACAAANGMWAAAAMPSRLALAHASGDVRRAQERVLRQILADNAGSTFGIRHAFSIIRTADEYRERVPLSTYDDYTDAVERIARGEQGVLTTAPVIRLVPTGGSTSGSKLIPHTAAMRRAMDVAVSAWVADLFARVPGLLRGAAYWSVSPALSAHPDAPSSRVPIGFDDDTEYLGWFARRAMSRVLAVPSLVRHIQDPETWRYITVAFLARSASLALISVWNPLYLRLLLEGLGRHWEAVADDISRGVLRPPGTLRPEIAAPLQALWRADPRRGDELRRIGREESQPARMHARLWPALRLLSCWADGNAGVPARELASLLPQARLQGKGLMATEGVVTVPIVGLPAAPLALRSHFFEFLPRARGPQGPIEEDGRTRLPHELAAGAEYSVVLTNGSGLYRYRLRDVVRVLGHWRECPLLEFVGKEDEVSDRVGEKLDGCHVQACIEKAAAGAGIAPVFAMLAWEAGDRGCGRYVLFIQAPGAPDSGLEQAARLIDAALRENLQYNYARTLGQLEAIDVFRVEESAADDYISACSARGQRLGDVKPTALHAGTGWARVFRGRFVITAGV